MKISLFLIMNSFICLVCNINLDILNDPKYFVDQICSNKYKNATINNRTVICNCDENYGNSTDDNYINGQKIQCSYPRKRRFIALFYSIFLPFGIDYIYIGQYIPFLIILFFCCFTIIGNCYMFSISQSTNYFDSKSNLFFATLAVLLVIWWIINIFLTAFGVVKDSHGYSTISDLYMLLNGFQMNSDM